MRPRICSPLLVHPCAAGILPRAFAIADRGHTRAVHRSGQVRAKSRETRERRITLCIFTGALRRNPFPPRAVVLARVISAEALDQPCAACVAVLQKPCIPARACRIGSVKQLVVAGGVRQLPGGRSDGNHHLDLSEASLSHLVVRGSCPSGRCSAKNLMWLFRPTSSLNCRYTSDSCRP